MKYIFSLVAILSLGLFAVKSSLYSDSEMTFDSSIAGTKAPKNIIDSLILLDVEYYNFSGSLTRGQLVINQAVEDDVRQAFEILKEEKFPIHKVVPIVKYDWSDDESMKSNNTSAFNYRFIAGTQRLSNHASGRAIDINPRQNPVIYSDGRISPKGAKYNPNEPGTLSSNSKVVIFLKSKGWRWGGDWTSLKDYHHFDKP
ncbi:MAG: M15 family metallopeptidase [Candidatus Kapabacteria bacterium]|nr:M15 family metallopeptidase [Ignavibacteriota bacterium]MCW5884560.1 M15 family metallopeptidase [Candidatus Kapabacteria bacterium]